MTLPFSFRNQPPLEGNGNGGDNAGPSATADVPVRADAGGSRPVAAGANDAGSGGVERMSYLRD